MVLGPAGDALNTGNNNILAGTNAGIQISSGNNNIALGTNALSGVTTGNSNIAFGVNAGTNAPPAGNLNIYLGNNGNAADGSTMRLGSSQSRTFIAGIRGTTTGVADAIPVVIDSNGQLGTVSSSARYKRDIRDMAGASASLLALRPVTFRYLEHGAGAHLQYGLIAEEVAEVAPELVIYENGVPETVAYHQLTPMLLNEVQRLHTTLARLEARIGTLETELEAMARMAARVAALEAVVRRIESSGH